VACDENTKPIGEGVVGAFVRAKSMGAEAVLFGARNFAGRKCGGRRENIDAMTGGNEHLRETLCGNRQTANVGGIFFGQQCDVHSSMSYDDN
jgi:hypothetical protein